MKCFKRKKKLEKQQRMYTKMDEEIYKACCKRFCWHTVELLESDAGGGGIIIKRQGG